MKLDIPPGSPPRDLEEARLTHGGRILSITVLRQSSVSKRTGEVRYKAHATTYTVERDRGTVCLTTESGEVYTVRPFECSCPQARLRRPHGGCKHEKACLSLGLFEDLGPVAGTA